LIQTLVSASRGVVADIEEVHRVEFVRLKPQPESRKPPQDEPEARQEKKPKPPPEPLEELTTSQERQRPPALKPQHLDLDLRPNLPAGPYLGNFEPEAAPIDLGAGEPSLQIPPVYPPRAKRMGIEGKVTVEFTITADGSVEDTKIVQADPSGVFDRSVLRAIRRWKFPPPRVNGRAIERRARKQIVFKLERR
jgi:protein TonB